MIYNYCYVDVNGNRHYFYSEEPVTKAMNEGYGVEAFKRFGHAWIKIYYE